MSKDSTMLVKGEGRKYNKLKKRTTNTKRVLWGRRRKKRCSTNVESHVLGCVVLKLKP